MIRGVAMGVVVAREERERKAKERRRRCIFGLVLDCWVRLSNGWLLLSESRSLMVWKKEMGRTTALAVFTYTYMYTQSVGRVMFSLECMQARVLMNLTSKPPVMSMQE